MRRHLDDFFTASKTSQANKSLLLSPALQPNPYTQDNYELQDTSSYQNAGAAGGGGGATSSGSQAAPLSQQDFLARVQSLRNDITRLTGDIETIGQLHQRSLGAADPQADQQLEHYVAQTQVRNTAIKDGIKGLERDLARTADASRKTKQTQLQSLRTFFKSELDSYQSIEREYRQKYRDQIARQYRIVNPEASEQEIQEAAETDWGNEGVFQTAVSAFLLLMFLYLAFLLSINLVRVLPFFFRRK